jgi:hypothetical protein
MKPLPLSATCSRHCYRAAPRAMRFTTCPPLGMHSRAIPKMGYLRLTTTPWNGPCNPSPLDGKLSLRRLRPGRAGRGDDLFYYRNREAKWRESLPVSRRSAAANARPQGRPRRRATTFRLTSVVPRPDGCLRHRAALSQRSQPVAMANGCELMVDSHHAKNPWLKVCRSRLCAYVIPMESRPGAVECFSSSQLCSLRHGRAPSFAAVAAPGCSSPRTWPPAPPTTRRSAG